MKTCTKCKHTDLIEVAKDSDTVTTQCSRCGDIQLWVNIAVIHTGPSPVKPMEHWAPAERVDGGTLKVTGVPCDPPWGRLDIPPQEYDGEGNQVGKRVPFRRLDIPEDEPRDDTTARAAFQVALDRVDLEPLARELFVPSEFLTVLPPDGGEPPKRSAKEIVKEAIKNGRWEFPRDAAGIVDSSKPTEVQTLHAFQVIKSGRVILDEFAILDIPYTQKVRIDRKDYFQGIRNGVQRRFLCDESSYHYFPTWDGAWAHLCALAQAEVTAAESALAHAKETLSAAKAMRPD